MFYEKVWPAIFTLMILSRAETVNQIYYDEMIIEIVID